MDIPQLERSVADLSLGALPQSPEGGDTPSDTEFIVSIGKIMVHEKILTEFALKILHNDIWADILTLETNEQKVRAGVYMTIVVNMTLFYGGYIQCKEFPEDSDTVAFKRLQKIALHFVEVLPKILRSITDKYLETYHGAKVASFVQGGKFDDYFPPHPEEQKILDQIAGAKEST
jgi:hypothetical protein